MNTRQTFNGRTDQYSKNEDMQPHDAILLSQSEVSKIASGWRLKAYEDIKDRLKKESEFPCVFSKNAFSKELLKFIFVEAKHQAVYRRLAQGLKKYVELSKKWDGALDKSYPLLIVFAQDMVCEESVEAYHRFGWEVLQKLHELDQESWPSDLATDPDSEAWSMCFSGMPIFCNLSNPAHEKRKSRNLGRHFTIVINPRERFDKFAGNNSSGRKVRENIRKRIERYDKQRHCPQLGTYGSGDLEWMQYGLLDENVERSDICPFSQKNNYK